MSSSAATASRRSSCCCTRAASRTCPSTPTRSTPCGITGPIVDIVNNTTKAVDLFITGHTHQAYNCVIDGRPVTSASSFGRVLTDIDLTIGRNGDVKSVSADNIPIYTAGRTPVEDVDALVARYEALSADLRQAEVGWISSDIRSGRTPGTTDDSRRATAPAT